MPIVATHRTQRRLGVLSAASFTRYILVSPRRRQNEAGGGIPRPWWLVLWLFPLLAPARVFPAPPPTVAPVAVSSVPQKFTTPELYEAPDEWIARSLVWVNDMLQQFPPAVVENPARRAALIRLDDILHIASAPLKSQVQQFHRMRLEQAVREIEQTSVVEGMRIWKLYNHGFFVRTPTVSFTFDLVSGIGTPGFDLDDALMARLVAQSDATFITHWHPDHASQRIARFFLAQNKPVIAPDHLWDAEPDLASQLIHPRQNTTATQPVPVQRGRQALELVTYHGHQGLAVPNNVYLVTSPEGLTVCHTGDQSNDDDFAWIDPLGNRHRIDVLLPACWAKDIKRLVSGCKPNLVITGHENEMWHPVDHREAYAQTYVRLFGTRFPFVVMTWGESYHYRRLP